MDRTIRTYNQIASEFTIRSWDIYLEKSMKRFTAFLPQGVKILDVGCGPGRDVVRFRELGYQTYGADLSVGMLEEAKQRIDPTGLLNCDMCHLPVSDESFEGVWLCASLLHLRKQRARLALREIKRILRKGGVLFVLVQLGTGERWTSNFGKRYFSYYQPEELVKMIKGAGMDVRENWKEIGDKVDWIHLIGTR